MAGHLVRVCPSARLWDCAFACLRVCGTVRLCVCASVRLRIVRVCASAFLCVCGAVSADVMIVAAATASSRYETTDCPVTHSAETYDSRTPHFLIACPSCVPAGGMMAAHEPIKVCPPVLHVTIISAFPGSARGHYTCVGGP